LYNYTKNPGDLEIILLQIQRFVVTMPSGILVRDLFVPDGDYKSVVDAKV